MRCWPTARPAHFGPVAPDLSDVPDGSPLKALARDLMAISAREAAMIADRFPKVQRRVGGYNLDALTPGRNDVNLAHILVGSEGTLGFSTRIELKLVAAAWPPRGRRLPLRQLPGRDGGGPAHRQARSDRGRGDRPHHARAGARHRDVPADHQRGRARRSGGDPVRGIRRGRPEGEFPPASAAQRADGRPRLRLEPRRARAGAA